MRIISGTARGVKLLEPSGNLIRPTGDMVKEAVFNMIQYDIEGRSVLDLFSGTGQLGIEALSRGAKNCVFVDQSRDACKLTNDNLKRSKLEHGTVILHDAIRYIENSGSFDLIFIDPPYNSGLLNKAVSFVTQFDKLNTGGIIICESPSADMPYKPEAPYSMLKQRRYGRIYISLYSKE